MDETTANSSASQRKTDEHAVILFDGVCNLCNGFVNFVIDRDPAAYFVLGALQSEEGQRLLQKQCGGLSGEMSSVVLIEDGRCYRQSAAGLRVLRRLKGVWPLFYVFAAIPRPILDRLYDWMASNRYRWFGKRDQCRVPTPELEARFLSGRGGA